MDFLFAFNGLSDMGWLFQNYGPFVAAVVFFIWRDYRREDRLSTRIKELEEEQREVILPLVKSCTEVITKNTQVMEQNLRVMDHLNSIIDRTLSS
jgi:hypothetical protein